MFCAFGSTDITKIGRLSSLHSFSPSTAAILPTPTTLHPEGDSGKTSMMISPDR